jgi:signal transduction histidine kinase
MAASACPLRVILDEKEIRQLILNMARNGLGAMQPGGTLTIGARVIKNSPVLFIKDEGTGLDDNLLSQIGTPFFTTKENGAGLGLAVCYRIVARHKAKIEVDTSPQGTTFWIRFPNSREHYAFPVR